MIRPRPTVSLTFCLAALALAGCGSERMARSGPAAEPAYTGSVRPPVEMGGRWLLASPGRGQCNVTFAGQPGALNGTLAPEGGCPGNFYMSRNWNFEAAGLVIRDHQGQPLGQLSLAGGARFDGRAVTGEPITLGR